MKALVIIPLEKDTGNLLSVIKDIKNNSPDVDYIVINGTDDFMIESILLNNEIQHVKTPYKINYTNALSIGVHHAIVNEYDLIIQYDSSGYFSAKDINYMIATYKNNSYDIIQGSRFIDDSILKQKVNVRTKILKLAIKMSSRLRLTDPGLNFRLLNRRTFKKFDKDSYWNVGVDSIFQLHKIGYKIKEVKIDCKISRDIEHSGWKNVISNTWTDFFSIILVQPFRGGKYE